MRPDCELCGLSFADRQELAEHMQQHLDRFPNAVDRLYECDNCRRTFLRSDDLEIHGLKVHA